MPPRKKKEAKAENLCYIHTKAHSDNKKVLRVIKRKRKKERQECGIMVVFFSKKRGIKKTEE